jgi:AAA+ ATPase superfamily predicted ATPase
MANYKTIFMDTNRIIGREKEQKRLQDLYHSDKAEFIAIYGRRRIGKTFLIRQLFENKLVFDLTGLAKANTIEQLVNFTLSLNRATKTENKVPQTWLFAFENLISLLKNLPKERKVIFIDEISWLDTPRSNFLTALEHFWNGWACGRSDIMLIVCGSATSWIMNKLINNHGGLHNRLTANIYLQPFTLHETELYLRSNKCDYSLYDISECYMTMGGIPYYLSRMDNSLSISQNIDNLFFAENAELKNEFQNLYASLFKNYADYIKIVEALSTKAKGLTRQELEKITGFASGGGLTVILKNLEYCGFIRAYNAFGKKKYEQLYQLLDAYTLFYFNYLEKNKYNDSSFWSNSINTPQHYAWAGYAFEILALQHIAEIKQALGISGVQSNVSTWRSENSTPAAQIDLLIDRKDGIINLCEIKFSMKEYTIDKDYEENLRNKIFTFKDETKTKKGVHLLMLTTYGLTRNKYSSIARKEVTLADLFKE